MFLFSEKGNLGKLVKVKHLHVALVKPEIALFNWVSRTSVSKSGLLWQTFKQLFKKPTLGLCIRAEMNLFVLHHQEKKTFWFLKKMDCKAVLHCKIFPQLLICHRRNSWQHNSPTVHLIITTKLYLSGTCFYNEGIILL